MNYFKWRCTRLKLIEAINHAKSGATIISCVGRRYTPDMLAPITYGRHYAVCTRAGMTPEEYKGTWEVAL